MRRFVAILIFLTLFASMGLAAAQDAADAPAVFVTEQAILNDTVLIDRVYSAGPGFVVVHAELEGSPGPIVGMAPVRSGWNQNLVIPVDVRMVTPVLFAMLHVDDGTVGLYEYDGQSGFDNPVMLDGGPIGAPFAVALLSAQDQFIEANAIRIAAVTTSNPAWVVVHADNNGAPGDILGQTAVPAGQSLDVPVTLNVDGRTSVLWPMLHTDDGEMGTFEYDGESGRDDPIILGVRVATAEIWTVPHVRVSDQIVLYGDSQLTVLPAPTIRVDSVLAAAPGFLVLHHDEQGTPGAIAGGIAVPAGFTRNVDVPLSELSPAPLMHVMLHVDDGVVGTYEYDGVNGLDAPVMVEDAPVSARFHAAPSITFEEQTQPGEIDLARVMMDAPGWVVIHASDNGTPGAILGYALVAAGLNTSVEVMVDPVAAGAQVFAMLYYDTHSVGVFEFGTVEGADQPVTVLGRPVVEALAPAQP